MTHQQGGRPFGKNMASRRRIITRSFKTKMELVTFVYALLSRYEGDNTLQLTTLIQPGRFEVSFAITAIIGSSPVFEKTPELPDAS